MKTVRLTAALARSMRPRVFVTFPLPAAAATRLRRSANVRTYRGPQPIPRRALLAAVLPSPTRYRVANPGPYVRDRQAWILRQMNGIAAAGLLRPSCRAMTITGV